MSNTIILLTTGVHDTHLIAPTIDGFYIVDTFTIHWNQIIVLYLFLMLSVFVVLQLDILNNFWWFWSASSMDLRRKICWR